MGALRPAFELLHAGPLEVVLDYHEERSTDLGTPWEQRVAALCNQERQRGQHIENLPLYRVLHWEVCGARLNLQLGQAMYEQYLGMSRLPGAPKRVIEPLTIAAACEVEDCLVIERRSATVAIGQGMLHVKPSGHVHPPDTVWQAVLAEAAEELALEPDELLEPTCLGWVRSLTASCYCLLYHFRTPLGWSELLARRPRDAWEHEELLALPIDPEGIASWLSSDANIAGPGRATVLLLGRQRFGEEWFACQLSRLGLSPLA